LSNSKAAIRDSHFKGYNGIFINPALLITKKEDDSNKLCPNNPQFYASPAHALIFNQNGEY
jgi:hypothetical protein